MKELIIDNLCYRHEERLLIDSISLRFRPGTLYAVLGPNGSGKTSLLKLLSGIWQPTAGRILLGTAPLHLLPRIQISELISMVPQSPQVNFDFTAEEMVHMGQYAQQKKNSSAVVDSLKATDVYHLRKRPITKLSIGERQRVYIARTLAAETPVILLDEPTSNLDIQHQLSIWKLLKKLAERGKTVIATLHDLHAAEKHCTQTAVLCMGKCVAQGIYNRTVTDETLAKVFNVKKEDL